MKLYVTYVTSMTFTPREDSGPWVEVGGATEEGNTFMVPRFLAELCKFELDHEHDDEFASRERVH